MSAPQTARERADDFIRWWVANNNSSLDQISNELTERIQAAERSAIERAAKYHDASAERVRRDLEAHRKGFRRGVIIAFETAAKRHEEHAQAIRSLLT